MPTVPTRAEPSRPPLRPLGVSRVFALLGASAVALSGLVGCESTQPAEPGTSGTAPRSNAPGTGPSSGSGAAAGEGLGTTTRGDLTIDHDAWRELGYRWDWAVEGIVNRGARVVEFEAAPDAIALRDDQNVVRVFDNSTGRRRWGIELEAPIQAFVSIDRVGDQLLVSSQSAIYTLTLEGGNLTARGSFGQSVSTPPAIYGPNALYGTPIGELIAFNHAAAGGQKAWGNANQTQAITGKPVVVGRAVGAVSQGGDVIFLDAGTGQLISRARIFGGIAGDPATDGTAMFIASLDQSVWAFTPDGRLRWRHRTDRPIRGQPVVYDGAVFVELGNGAQAAFDAVSGKVLWETPNLKGVVMGAAKDELLVWNAATNTLTLVDRVAGDPLGSIVIRNAQRVFVDQFADGNLFVATRDGVLAKFIAR